MYLPVYMGEGSSTTEGIHQGKIFEPRCMLLLHGSKKTDSGGLCRPLLP